MAVHQNKSVNFFPPQRSVTWQAGAAIDLGKSGLRLKTPSLENKKEGRGDARGLLFHITLRMCRLREAVDHFLVGAP